MKTYLRDYRGGHGFTKVSGIGDGDMKLTEFGIIALNQGERHAAESNDMEVALIVLGGRCSISVGSSEFPQVGERPDVFSGKPDTVYVPKETTYEITATHDVEIAWTAAPSNLETEPYEIKPEQVKEAHLGEANYQRDAYLILTDAFPASKLFIGEAFVPSGNHASFPPHRHDFDNLPDEVDMEEIYFFRFNPPQGYGIQKVYTDDRSIDETYTVKHNDLTLLPEGYHPVINAPGYTMYYLWIMAGENNRMFKSIIDPDHERIVKKG